ncbi:MAG: EAL domain-containing protein [Zoogloeaceae bacterium]|nr:EAL domain-containing protein [Zoogloeaceae bacterium]
MSRQPDFDVARQPIVDRLGRSVAYELLFRRDGGRDAEVRDSAGASSQVILRTFRQIGADAALGRGSAFINLDEEGLWSPTLARLPKERVVLELLETLVVSDRIVHRCEDLKARGFRLALDDLTAIPEDDDRLLSLADVIKVDVLALDPATLEALVTRLRDYPAKLLAEKVDSSERASHCLELGFDLLQGYWLGAPERLRG